MRKRYYDDCNLHLVSLGVMVTIEGLNIIDCTVDKMKQLVTESKEEIKEALEELTANGYLKRQVKGSQVVYNAIE